MAVRRRARSTSAKEREQILPEAEMEILAILQREGEAEAKRVRELLAPFRPMTHASVITLLGRLEAKGLVLHRKADVGKSFVYSPARSARPLYRSLLRRVMRRIFADDPATLVAELFEARALTSHELEQIQRLVSELKDRRR